MFVIRAHAIIPHTPQRADGRIRDVGSEWRGPARGASASDAITAGHLLVAVALRYDWAMGRGEIVGGVLLAALAIAGGVMTQVGPGLFPNHAQEIFWIAAAVASLSILGLIILFFWPRKNRNDAADSDGQIQPYGDTITQTHSGTGDNIVKRR